ncbi:AbfB domain-containing protein [Streptomyces sp. NPDC051636]|uniref:AbfB domain-containing protein n=1 Tax=Streptomyces sp. NPDC051636 TaxID=3365663 RepID=UPI0037B53139
MSTAPGRLTRLSRPVPLNGRCRGSVPDDGSATFRSDASFGRRAGPAGFASGVSLESYNCPGRYVRPYGNLLYVQPVSTAPDRADAAYCLEQQPSPVSTGE